MCPLGLGGKTATISCQRFQGPFNLPNRLHVSYQPLASDASNEQWVAARPIARELDSILDGSMARRIAIDRTAAELRRSTRQVYNPLARYRIDGTVTSWCAETERIILDGDWMNCAAMSAPPGSVTFSGEAKGVSFSIRPTTVSA
jgi:hypothetical protein